MEVIELTSEEEKEEIIREAWMIGFEIESDATYGEIYPSSSDELGEFQSCNLPGDGYGEL